MQDSSLVLIAVCGLSVVCVGTIAVVALLVVRFTGRTLGEMIGGLGGFGGVAGALVAAAADAGDDDVESGIRRERRRTTSASRDLRARAQSLDFNEAVNRYRSGDQPASSQSARPVRPTSPTNQPTTPFPNVPEPRESGASLRARRRGNPEQEVDDMLGGLMDEDGDLF